MPALAATIYNKSTTVVPDDTANLPLWVQNQIPTNALYIGAVSGGATITVVYPDDKTQTFTVAAGTYLPVKVKRVNTTSTLATLIVALYVI